MLPTFKPLIHTADIACGRPEAVVLAADEQEMTAYILNGDHDLLAERSLRLRVVKHLSR